MPELFENLDGSAPISKVEATREVEREIAMRERVYRRNVHIGKMSQSEATRRIAVMHAIKRNIERNEWHV